MTRLHADLPLLVNGGSCLQLFTTKAGPVNSGLTSNLNHFIVASLFSAGNIVMASILCKALQK